MFAVFIRLRGAVSGYKVTKHYSLMVLNSLSITIYGQTH